MFELVFLLLAIEGPVSPLFSHETSLTSSVPIPHEFKDGVKGWKVMIDIRKKDFPSEWVPKHFEVLMAVSNPDNWRTGGYMVVCGGDDDDLYGLWHCQNNDFPDLHMFYINGVGKETKDGRRWGKERCDRDPPNRDFQILVYIYPKEGKKDLGKPTFFAKAYSDPKDKERK